MDMRLVTLHNAVNTAAQCVGAQAVALKLLPEPAHNHAPLDVVVGDLAQLSVFAWQEGCVAPDLNVARRSERDLFCVAGALNLYVAPDERRAATCVNLSEELLNAPFGPRERVHAVVVPCGALWLGFAFERAADLQRCLDQPLLEPILGVAGQVAWQFYQDSSQGSGWAADSPPPKTLRADQTPVEALAAALRKQVHAQSANSQSHAPLGRWLADIVVLTAIDLADGVVLSAAAMLGVPETTLRRQLKKARLNAENPFQVTSETWRSALPELTTVLADLIRKVALPEGVVEHCQVMLLREVAAAVDDDHRTGAALMDITPPTYTRWLARYRIPVLPDLPLPNMRRKAS